MYERGLILLWPRFIFRGCYGGQTANVGCCIHYSLIIRRRRRAARVGREWSRDWLKERQSEKGMEEFVVTELAADLSGFHSFLRMTHDQFMELFTHVASPSTAVRQSRTV